MSQKFDAIDFQAVSFKGNIYDFSVDKNTIDKFEILNIREYSVIENDIIK